MSLHINVFICLPANNCGIRTRTFHLLSLLPSPHIPRSVRPGFSWIRQANIDTETVLYYFAVKHLSSVGYMQEKCDMALLFKGCTIVLFNFRNQIFDLWSPIVALICQNTDTKMIKYVKIPLNIMLYYTAIYSMRVCQTTNVHVYSISKYQ